MGMISRPKVFALAILSAACLLLPCQAVLSKKARPNPSRFARVVRKITKRGGRARPSQRAREEMRIQRLKKFAPPKGLSIKLPSEASVSRRGPPACPRASDTCNDPWKTPTASRSIASQPATLATPAKRVDLDVIRMKNLFRRMKVSKHKHQEFAVRI